jgi:hypothetical protein
MAGITAGIELEERTIVKKNRKTRKEGRRYEEQRKGKKEREANMAQQSSSKELL